MQLKASDTEQTNQQHIIKKMTAEQKIQAALDLYNSVRALKIASLRIVYPNMDKEEIDRQIKEIFLYAGT